MCGCGKYNDEDSRLGVLRYGIFEMHTRSHCMTKDVSTWRTRLFHPIAAFFDRLGGPYSAKIISRATLDVAHEADKARREQYRAARREALRRIAQERENTNG